MQDLIGAAECAELLGIGRVTFWRRRKASRYPDPVLHIGNRPVFDRKAIEAAAKAEKEDTK
jgi:predicted DNA-binding transcriptional regulator AlpA